MSTIIYIETATEVCSAALSNNGDILKYNISTVPQSHSSLLGVFVEEIMKYVRHEGMSIDAIAVSSGPGSYTGLRIGVSEAKGLSYGLNVPLISIPTHKIMAQQVLDIYDNKQVVFCPMIDARRMEVYSTFYDSKLDVLRDTSADIVDENIYNEILDKHQVLFFGNGADKCKEVIHHANAKFIDDIKPEAKSMIKLAEKAFFDKDFVDVAYFEPFYLKEFVATVPKNKVINI